MTKLKNTDPNPQFLQTAVNCRFFIYNFNRFLLFHRNKRKVILIFYVMKKEFLDFLYDKRASLQAKIDDLVQVQKEPISICCDSMPTSIYNKPLEEVRLHIQSINFIISEYLLTHKL